MIAAVRTALLTMVVLAVAGLAPAVARADVASEVRALVEATLPSDLALVNVTVPSGLSGGDLEIRWKSAPRAGNSRVLVLSGPERARRSRWVAIALARKQSVPVARRALPAGTVLTAHDVTVDVRAETGALALDPSALVGLRIRRAVAAGAAFTESDVELGAPVARGTEVEVIVRSGALSITRRGKLENTARVGDQVRVRVEATRRIVSGRLTGAGTVTVSGAR